MAVQRREKNRSFPVLDVVSSENMRGNVVSGETRADPLSDTVADGCEAACCSAQSISRDELASQGTTVRYPARKTTSIAWPGAAASRLGDTSRHAGNHKPPALTGVDSDEMLNPPDGARDSPL